MFRLSDWDQNVYILNLNPGKRKKILIIRQVAGHVAYCVSSLTHADDLLPKQQYD